MRKIEAQSPASQGVLPDFQSALGIPQDTTEIPTDHIEDLREERLVSIGDVKRFIVELGISTQEQVDRRIIEWNRDSTYVNDILSTAVHIKIEACKNPEIRDKFEGRYGVPMNMRNLFKHGFGGINIDEENASLPRSPEDKRLDKERRRQLTGRSER